MIKKQLAVFLENKSGSLVEAMSILEEEGIKLLSTCVTSTMDFGVLYMIVDDPEKGQRVLHDQGVSSRILDVAVIQVDDNGGIVSVLNCLSKEELNVEYLYTFSEGTSGKTWMAFRCEDTEIALGKIKNLSGVQTEEITS